MRFKINYNGKYEDSLIIEGDSMEEIRETARCELTKRNWSSKDCWSERMEE